MDHNDRCKMIAFVARHLPDGEGIVTLASGAGGTVTAYVTVQDDEIEIRSNCPEWASLRAIYDDLRWNVMPNWERRAWLQIELKQSAICPCQKIDAVADRLEKIASQFENLKPANTRDAKGSLAANVAAAPDRPLNTSEVAALLGCSYSEARDRLLDGRIKAFKDGRWMRTRRAWVEDYVTRKLIVPSAAVSEVKTIRVKKPLMGHIDFKKGGTGYQFLVERQRNRK